MKVKLRVRPECTDRRSVDLHLRAASIEEKRFAYRVARNPTEQDRVQREQAREFDLKYVDDPEPYGTWDEVAANEAGIPRSGPI